MNGSSGKEHVTPISEIADDISYYFFLPQYVPKDLLPVYRDKVVPVADIITPNQFEAEWVLHFFYTQVNPGIKTGGWYSFFHLSQYSTVCMHVLGFGF